MVEVHYLFKEENEANSRQIFKKVLTAVLAEKLNSNMRCKEAHIEASLLVEPEALQEL